MPKLINYEGFKYFKGKGKWRYSLFQDYYLHIDTADLMTFMSPVDYKSITSDTTVRFYNNNRKVIFQVDYIYDEAFKTVSALVTITTDYKWDGVTGFIDLKSLMEGSLVHDVMLQLVYDYGHFSDSDESLSLIHLLFFYYSCSNSMLSSTIAWVGLRLFHKPWNRVTTWIKERGQQEG